MSDIFSHAPSARTKDSGPQPDVELTMTVNADPDQAFAGWTDHIHLWWPVADFSMSGDDAFIDFEGDELVETSTGDQMISWGTVFASDPPSLLSLSWHPGGSPLQATHVRIEFSPLESESHGRTGTQMSLTHDGWSNTADPAAEQSRYARLWPDVLAKYVRFMGGASADR